MKHTKILFLAALLFASPIAAQQVEVAATDDAELPEGMQPHEIDSLLHDWSVRSFLTFDDNCESTNENPTFEPEVYISRLRRLPNVIPMTYNAVVQKYIDLYSGRLRQTVAVMLGAGNFYNPIFEEALESYQVPLELKYLPIIESALNPGATSRVGAAGLWQFMIGTGKQYGLEVTSLIDERRDPIKASYAAARYLRDLYAIFGDWTLVIASYNCGPGNVSKAIKRAGGATDYWAIYSYLPRETQGYVPAFIAANYIMNYYCDHNICPINTSLPQGTDTLMLNRNIRMEHIAANCSISIDELKALNPQYRTTLIPGDSHQCILRMPAEKVGTFLEMQDSIYAAQVAEEAQQRPVVEVAVAETKSRGKADRGGGKTVTVRSGDSLGAIARRNGTTVARLRSLNGLKGTTIRAGQRLRVK
ncbi:MAG: transglycosylase SLT domain-containing protein [Bacteroidaceae bacterium]|nr:transglycosylase SLT domain-containing protein [Bacteroidaceae bacterium]